MKATFSTIAAITKTKIRSSLGAYQLFQVSRQAINLLISIIMVKSGLQAEVVGQVELHFYIAALLSLVWLRPLNQYMLYEDRYSNDSVYVETFRLMILFILSFFGIYLFAHRQMDQLLFGETLNHLLPYFLFFAGQSILSLSVCWLYRKGRFYSIYSLSLLFIIFSLFPFILLLYGASLDLTFILLGVGGFAYIVICLFSLSNAMKSAYSISLKRIKQLTFPLALYGIISMLPMQFDAWLVQNHFSDNSIFAVFRYGARELPFVVTLLVGLSQAMVPLLKQNEVSGLMLLKQKSKQYMLYIMPLLIILLITSRPLYLLLYSDEYVKSVLLFDLMLLLVFSKFLFPQSFLLSKDDNKLLYQIGLIELIINIVASIILIQYFGLAGVVIGTIIAFYFEKIALICIVRMKYNVGLSQYLNLSYWTFGLILFTGLLAAKYLFYY